MTTHNLLTTSLAVCLSTALLSLTACQTLPNPNDVGVATSNEKRQPHRLEKFGITGKISMVGISEGQSGSAFYAWGQEAERFTIELQGMMGLGFTTISYNGTTATLSNSTVGTITADNPEALLQQATGWQAPISQLPYWISGSPAPSDSHQTLDGQRRLINASNNDWTASFNYDNNTDKLPNRITALNTDGSKVTMSIAHFKNE